MTPTDELVGTGPDLVLIPGTFADRRTWSRVIGRLTSRFRCLLLDPRGTGRIAGSGHAIRHRALANGIGDARLEVIDGAGHSPHLETPMTFARLVSTFLTS